MRANNDFSRALIEQAMKPAAMEVGGKVINTTMPDPAAGGRCAFAFAPILRSYFVSFVDSQCDDAGHQLLRLLPNAR